MISVPTLQRFMQHLASQGKMSLEFTHDEKRVNCGTFARACAEVIVDKYKTIPSWIVSESDVNWVYRNYSRSQLIERVQQHIMNIFYLIGSEYVNRSGRFLVRFAKDWRSHNSHRMMELPDEFFGIVGGMMKDHVLQSSSYIVDFTNRFDWEDGMFGKGDSCWWRSLTDSRPTFNAGGGWGIRFYNSMDDWEGLGRCWILPRYQSLIGFNAYNVEPVDVRMIMTHLLQQSFGNEYDDFIFRKIEVHNNETDIPYINGGSGFLITTPDNAKMLDPEKEEVNIKLKRVHLEHCADCRKALVDVLNDYNVSEFDARPRCNECEEKRKSRGKPADFVTGDQKREFSWCIDFSEMERIMVGRMAVDEARNRILSSFTIDEDDVGNINLEDL